MENMKKLKEEQMSLADFQKKLFWIFLVITSAIVIICFCRFFYQSNTNSISKKPRVVLVLNTSLHSMPKAYSGAPSTDRVSG